MNLLKLNDIVIDVSTWQKQAVKKSIEFFLGAIIDLKDIEVSIDYIREYLENTGHYLRDAAIIKKMNEYYLGKEFNGLIGKSTMCISLKKLEKFNNITLLSIMSAQETRFLLNKFRIKCNVISAKSVNEGLKKAKKKFKELTFVSNSVEDYKVALKNKVDFIGYKMKFEGKAVKKLDDLF